MAPKTFKDEKDALGKDPNKEYENYWTDIRKSNPKIVDDIKGYFNLKESDKSIYTNKKQYGICGLNKFVKNAVSRQGHDYTKGKDDPCHPCTSGPISKGKGSSGSKEYDDFLKKQTVGVSADGRSSIFPNDIDDYNRMCHDNTLVWFPSQRSEDPYINKFADKEKFDTTDSKDPMLLKWINDRMYDNEIKCMVAGDGCMHKGIVDNYNKLTCGSKPCANVDDIKEDIIKVTDSPSITCEDIHTNFESQIKQHDGPLKKSQRKFTTHCKAGKGGKSVTLKDTKYIIPDQYKQWENQILRKKHKEKKELKVGDVGIKLQPPTPGFETCMNQVFSNSNIIDDRTSIEKIKKTDDPAKLDPDEINYIKKKLLAFLKESNQKLLRKCIKEDLYLDTTICNADLSLQMASILGIIFKVVDSNFTGNTLDQPENKEKLIELISIFGDLIPRVFERIITLSESVEMDKCGKISPGTRNLHILYKKLFKRGKNVVNFDFGISDMISTATNQEFDRTTVLMVLGIAFLKFF